MKTKLKIIHQKNNQGIIVDYFRLKNISSYRYELLNKIFFEINMDLNFMIDTNLQLKKKPIEEIEQGMKDHDIDYLITPIKVSGRKLMGLKFLNFKKNKEEKIAYLIVCEIEKSKFTNSFFTNTLANYDIAIGIGKKKSLFEIQSLYAVDYDMVLFNEDTFENCIYDSVIYSRIRTSFDIEEIALSSEK